MLTPETAWGVSAADLRRGDGAPQEKLSVTTVWGISTSPAVDAIASKAPVTPCMELLVKLRFTSEN